jgi:hypothetical protein
MGALPLLLSDQWLSLLFTGVFSFTYWAVESGVSASLAIHQHSARDGISRVFVDGIEGRPYGDPGNPNLTARWGLGFVHFLYSRWVWNISDPKIRATIGRGIFSADAVHRGV